MNFKKAWEIHNLIKLNKQKNKIDNPSFPKSGWIFPCLICRNPTSQTLIYDKIYENICSSCMPIMKDFIRWKTQNTKGFL